MTRPRRDGGAAVVRPTDAVATTSLLLVCGRRGGGGVDAALARRLFRSLLLSFVGFLASFFTVCAAWGVGSRGM